MKPLIIRLKTFRARTQPLFARTKKKVCLTLTWTHRINHGCATPENCSLLLPLTF